MAILIPRYAQEPFDPRRRSLLIAALEAGVFGAATLPLAARPGAAAVLGSNPGRLPAGRSIYTLEGSATINGAAASLDSGIKPGDTVETGRASRLIFVDRGNAHILRENSRVTLSAPSDAANVLRVFTGVLLSVFGRRKRRLVTSAATIGIRGTDYSMRTCAGDCGNNPDGDYYQVHDGGIFVATEGGGQSDYQAGDFAYVQDPAMTPVSIPEADADPLTDDPLPPAACE